VLERCKEKGGGYMVAVESERGHFVYTDDSICAWHLTLPLALSGIPYFQYSPTPDNFVGSSLRRPTEFPPALTYSSVRHGNKQRWHFCPSYPSPALTSCSFCGHGIPASSNPLPSCAPHLRALVPPSSSPFSHCRHCCHWRPPSSLLPPDTNIFGARV
jgi:hypothetical protein